MSSNLPEIKPVERKVLDGGNLPAIRKKFMSDEVIREIQDAMPTAIGRYAKEMAVRYVKMGYAVISQNPTLQECSVKSLVRAMSQSASLGLEIDQRGLAYLVPYKNKGIMEAQLQIGYQGLMELAYRSSKVKSIKANCIYESEKDKVKIKRIDGRFYVEHPFTFEQPEGEMIAVYATAEVDGVLPQTVVLRREEVEKFRSKSKAPDSPAWKDHYDAMAKKTAIRQLAKFLPKSAVEELTRAAAIDEYEDFVTAQNNATQRIDNEQGSELIDVTFEQSGDNQELTDEPDAETQQKAAEQKESLNKSEGKIKAKTKPKKVAKNSDDSLGYHCDGCNRDLGKIKAEDKVKGWQCPFCLSWRVYRKNAEPVPVFTKD